MNPRLTIAALFAMLGISILIEQKSSEYLKATRDVRQKLIKISNYLEENRCLLIEGNQYIAEQNSILRALYRGSLKRPQNPVPLIGKSHAK